MRADKVHNESIREKIGVVPIENKLREGRLGWFGHVKRNHTEAPVRQVEYTRLDDRKKKRGRPNLTRRRVVQHDLKALHIFENLIQNYLGWGHTIHIADPKFLK